MRLKIEIARSFFSDARKDRPGDETAVIQFRSARVRVVQNDETDKFWMLGGEITDERHNIMALFVAAVRINLLGRPGLASDGEAGNGRGGRGTAIAHNSGQRITDLSGCLGRDDLTQNDGRKRAYHFTIGRRDWFDDSRRHKFTAVGDYRPSRRRHTRSLRDWMSHVCSRD